MILISVFISLVPLFFKTEIPNFLIVEHIIFGIFATDYVLRWIVADLKIKKGKASFFIYPVTFWAIIDFISLLPLLGLLNPAFVLLRIIRVFRIFRIFKGLRYSRHIYMIARVIKNSKGILLVLAMIAGLYIVISALVIFNIEPQTFDSFFDAIYWAVTALTTVGYGDIFPVTTGGKIISMISSIMGVAVIAMPSGVITAGFMTELNKNKQ